MAFILSWAISAISLSASSPICSVPIQICTTLIKPLQSLFFSAMDWETTPYTRPEVLSHMWMPVLEHNIEHSENYTSSCVRQALEGLWILCQRKRKTVKWQKWKIIGHSLYAVSISLRSEAEIKTFSDKGKLTEFFICRPRLCVWKVFRGEKGRIQWLGCCMSTGRVKNDFWLGHVGWWWCQYWAGGG